MKIKLFLLALMSSLLLNRANATLIIPAAKLGLQEVLTNYDLPSTNKPFTINSFLSLTPKKYKELTGKKLSLLQIVKLKVAQRIIKEKMHKAQANNSAVPQWLYIVLAIFGFTWVGMGVMDNWGGSNWWITLILYLIFWLPGFIFSMIKMNEYY